MEEKFKKKIYFILQFVDSVRFIASSLSDFVNYLSEGIHRIKCKYGHDNYYEKMLILTNILMIGKNSMKHHYLRKETFIVT